MILPLILITFLVFVIFWFGDLYLTLRTVNRLGRNVEINPIVRFILLGRKKLIYLFKPLELGAFLYLIWYLTTFEGAIPFYILLVFILVYGILVINNAHVYYKATNKESVAFKVIFMLLLLSTLSFIYLNYLFYLDLKTSYSALSESNEKYNQLLQKVTIKNDTLNLQKNNNTLELDLPIRRPK